MVSWCGGGRHQAERFRVRTPSSTLFTPLSKRPCPSPRFLTEPNGLYDPKATISELSMKRWESNPEPFGLGVKHPGHRTRIKAPYKMTSSSDSHAKMKIQQNRHLKNKSRLWTSQFPRSNVRRSIRATHEEKIYFCRDEIKVDKPTLKSTCRH